MEEHDTGDWYFEQQEMYYSLNNELVISDYARFCEDNEIHLMVLGDALGINQGAVRDYKDTPIGRWFKLQEDLLNIYNKAKRDFHFYHSSVVSFHFTTHTDFSFKSVPVDEFILSVEHLMNGHYVRNILLKSYLAIFFIFQIIIAIFIDPLRTTASFIALTLTFPMLCALLSFHPESLSA